MQFEYKISKHPADDFKHFVYFCTDQGECNLEDLDSDQSGALSDLLNEEGAAGWELVQVYFRPEGIVAIWKRAI